MIKLFFIFLFFVGCGGSNSGKKLRCPSFDEGCPEYFVNFWNSTITHVEAQDKYMEKRESFRLKHTYNQQALKELIEIEKPILPCLESTPLGNAEERRKFFIKMRYSDQRAVHETDRYFQDRLSEHYDHSIICFKKADKELNKLISKYGG